MHPREEIAGVEFDTELIKPLSRFPGLRLLPVGASKLSLNDLVTVPENSHAAMMLAREYGYAVFHDSVPLDEACGLNFVGSAWEQVATEWHADFYSTRRLAGIFLSKVDDGLPRDDTGVVDYESFVRVMRLKRNLFDPESKSFIELDLPLAIRSVLEQLYEGLSRDDSNLDVFELFDRFYVRLFKYKRDVIGCVKSIHSEITAVLEDEKSVYYHQHHPTNALVIDNIEKGCHPVGPNVLHARRRGENQGESGKLWKGYVLNEQGTYNIKKNFSS